MQNLAKIIGNELLNKQFEALYQNKNSTTWHRSYTGGSESQAMQSALQYRKNGANAAKVINGHGHIIWCG